MGRTKKAATPPRIAGPISVINEAVEIWISPPHTWSISDLLAYIAHAEGGGRVAWERHDDTGTHTVARPLEPGGPELVALADLKALVVHSQGMRRGRQPGSYGALRGVLEAYEAKHDGAPHAAIWDHLLALKDQRDETIEDVRHSRANCDADLGCHEGPHVHWLDDRGDTQTTSAKRVANLIGEIRKLRKPRRPD